jgi:hypothetical protein
MTAPLPGLPPGTSVVDRPLPLTFLQGFGDVQLVVAAKYLSLFFQDDIRLHRTLVLKAGVRYDLNRVRFVPRDDGT